MLTLKMPNETNTLKHTSAQPEKLWLGTVHVIISENDYCILYCGEYAGLVDTLS